MGKIKKSGRLAQNLKLAEDVHRNMTLFAEIHIKFG